MGLLNALKTFLIGEPKAAPESGPKEGWVSVWVGDWTDELDLDGYLGPAFEADHGVRITGQGGYTWKDGAVPLEELLDGFFLFEKWGGPLLAEAERRRVTTAACAFFELHYRHCETDPVESPLRFAGSVEIQR